MVPEVFCDGIGRIGFADGMVRIELISRSAAAFDGIDGARGEARQLVVMTAEAFARSFAVQQKALAKLAETGAIRLAPAEREESEPASPSASARTPRSPNFPNA
jgi:hypothetical protein